MNAKEKHQCEEMVWRGRPLYKYTECETPATVIRDGKRYCKRHDPEQVKARQAEQSAKWERKRAGENAEWRRKNAKDHFCEGLTVEFMEQNRAKDRMGLPCSAIEEKP